MNKISKVIISVFCIASMLSTTAYAKGISTKEKSAVQQVSQEKLKKVELKNQNVKDLHEDKTLNKLENNMKGQKLSKDSKLQSNFNGFNSGNKIDAKATANSNSSVSKSFQGTITKEGGYTYVLASLATNQILQATLKCPNNPNLDYDLYIYEVKDDGTLGDCIDSSTTTTYFNKYPDGTQKTLDEGVAGINKGTTVKKYAVIIYAKKGASATDTFTLNISLDVAGSYDAAEPNNNPYKAYTITEGTTSGANLNTPNDQDWYAWNVPVDFNKATITVDSGYKAEVYNASGSSMVLVNPDANNEYSLSKGYYYIKVFNDSNNFTPASYKLSVKPTKFNPAKIMVDMNGDMGKDFPSYDGTEDYLRFKRTLSPTVTVSTENGYAVSGCPVSLYWQSESWTEQSGNKTRTSGIKYTGSDGKVVVNLTVPIAIGKETYLISGPMSFMHYFDIDTVKITAADSLIYSTFVYHFANSVYISG